MKRLLALLVLSAVSSACAPDPTDVDAGLPDAAGPADAGPDANAADAAVPDGGMIDGGPDAGPPPPPPRTWDTNFLSPGVVLADGSPGIVYAIAVDGDDVYFGGRFDSALGVAARNIFIWNQVSDTWRAVGAGLDDTVRVITVGPDSRIYVGGDFATAGATPAAHVAAWDGTTWSEVAGGTDGPVLAIEFDDTGALYVGGEFATAGSTSANNVAKWDGSWSVLGLGENNGTDGPVHAIEALGVDIYVGGQIGLVAGAVTARGLAVWNGLTWRVDFDPNATVNDIMATSPANVFVATTVGPARRCSTEFGVCARIPQTFPLEAGGEGHALAIAELSAGIFPPFSTAPTAIVAGELGFGTGSYAHVGLATASAGGWPIRPEDDNMDLYAIAARDGGMIVGGEIADSPFNGEWGGFGWPTGDVLGIGACGLARIDFSNPGTEGTLPRVSVLGDNIYAAVRDLDVVDGAIVASGSFEQAGTTSAAGVASWDPASGRWSDLNAARDLPRDSARDIRVPEIEILDGTVYAVGGFHSQVWQQQADGAWTRITARPDITEGIWATPDGELLRTAHLEFDLPAGSWVSRWNGTDWDRLGFGVDLQERGIRIAPFLGGLYLKYGLADGTIAVDRWDGTALVRVVDELERPVQILADGTDLIVSSRSEAIGGVFVNHIARWDGTTFSPLGVGLTEGLDAIDVRLLAINDLGLLYVVGNMARAGGIDVDQIALWDGSAWANVGTPPTVGGVSNVLSILPHDGYLYVGGEFGERRSPSFRGFMRWRE